MGSDVSSPTSQSKPGGGLARYRSFIELGVAAIVGLVVLPAIFLSLTARDILLGGRVSVVDLVWLVLAVIVVGIIGRSRSAVISRMDRVTTGVLASIPPENQPPPLSPSASAASSTNPLQRNALVAGHALIDIIFLFILQAVLRQPLVGVVGGEASVGIVDGVFVVVVVFVTVFLLVRLRHASRPLIERLAAVGLDQVIPTAGFTSGSASATFAARLTTTTARLAVTSSPSSRGASHPVESSKVDASTEGTVLARTEATVLAADATVVASAPEGAPIDRRAAAEDDPTFIAVSDQTVIAPPPVGEHRKDGTI